MEKKEKTNEHKRISMAVLCDCFKYTENLGLKLNDVGGRGRRQN